MKCTSTRKKRTWRQENLSRQEKLYADILASKATGINKKARR